MNVRPVIEDSVHPKALGIAFNSDKSCFAVGLESGFTIFNTDPCQLNVLRDFNAGIGAVEMLGRANYVALVGGGKQPKFPQNKVVIWDDAKQKAILTLEFKTAVRRVKLSKTRIAVVLQNSVHLYSFSAQPDKISTYETADNPLGLCCITPKLLAFPGRTPGQVQLVEVETGNVTIVPAHSSALRAIEISPDGELMATASDAGTLIRVFATSNCARIAELRRGVDHATIFSLAISPSGKLLAVTSDKSTLHVFDIPYPGKAARPESSPSRRSTFNGAAASAGEDASSQKWGILGKIPLLPRVFSDIYSFSSAPFELGDETPTRLEAGLDGYAGPQKGMIGWTNDQTLVVLGAGRDARWEKFFIAEGEDGKRYCVRDGWKRYLGAI